MYLEATSAPGGKEDDGDIIVRKSLHGGCRHVDRRNIEKEYNFLVHRDLSADFLANAAHYIIKYIRSHPPGFADPEEQWLRIIRKTPLLSCPVEFREVRIGSDNKRRLF
jgi:hypothetical protein